MTYTMLTSFCNLVNGENIPMNYSYKDIGAVEIVHRLHQVVNIKG